MRSATCLILFLLAAPLSLSAQHELSLEGSFVRGTLGYARAAGGSTLVGVETGFGFPQLDRTWVPAQDTLGLPDFEEYFHVAAFLRHRFGERAEVDTGLRASIADLFPCDASDCWPQPFAGAYVQPMIGWKRLKAGVRLTAGWIGERERASDGSTFTVGFSPFLLRYTLPL